MGAGMGEGCVGWGGPLLILTQRKFVCFLFEFELLMVGALFHNEEQKWWARDVFDTFAAHADLDYGVTDPGCWRFSRSCFKR